MRRRMEGTLEYAHFLARHINSDLEAAVVAVLCEIGIPTKRLGFEYLKRSIMLAYENPTRNLTKEIYPAVIEFYGLGTDVRAIDQAILTALLEGWAERDEDAWAVFFPHSGRKLKRPTNTEFIYQIVHFMELWKGCCKGVGCERV